MTCSSRYQGAAGTTPSDRIRQRLNEIYGMSDGDYSGLMPANLITLAHFSVSSAMNFPNSAGEPANTSHPRSARRPFIVGSARAALISLLSFSMISVGVALGAPIPYQPLAS